jgi:acyl-CoA thioester hydrolase
LINGKGSIQNRLEFYNVLVHQTEVTVRFNEADPLGIVWHGHYVRYFEDGREAFGKHYGISYLDFYAQGLVIPIVSVHCDFKKALRYGDTIVVETTYIPTPAAKLKFEYKIRETKTNDLVAVGNSVQVFTDIKSFQLQLTTPSFYEAWKKRWGIA